MKYPPDDPKLTAYALGELDPGETAAVSAAVENSAECRRTVGETRETAGLLADALQTESCPELSPAQRAAIETALAGGVGPVPSPGVPDFPTNPPGRGPGLQRTVAAVSDRRNPSPDLPPAVGDRRYSSERAQPSFLAAMLAWRPQLGTVVLWATACLVAAVGWGLWAGVFSKTGRIGSQQITQFSISLDPKAATTPSSSLSEANQLAMQTAASSFFQTPILPDKAGVLVATYGIGAGNGYTNFNGYVGTSVLNAGSTNPNYAIINNGASYRLGGGNGILNFNGGALQAAGTTGSAPQNSPDALTKYGANTLTLGGGNAYTYGGTLTPAGSTYVLGGGGGTLITDNGPTYVNGVNLTIAGTTSSPLMKNGAGTLALTAGNIYAGGTVVNSGTLQLQSLGNAGDTITYSGPVTVNNGSLTLNSLPSPASGIIGGWSKDSSGALMKNGAGTLVLNGNNGFSGGVILGAGRISSTAPVAFAGGVLVVANPSDVTVNVGGNGAPVVWAATPYYSTQYESETYAPIRDNPFLAVAEHPLSTFSIDVDTASYSNVRRFLLQGRLPPPNAVRIEEMIDYFTYDYAQPKRGEPFSVNIETAACPWAGDHRLVRIGLKGREVTAAKRPPCNLVFLIDVSGSMGDPNKLSLIKPAMRLLVEQLTENERVAIVVFNDTARAVLASTSGDHKQEILDAMESLQAGGCTNGGDGLRLAYDVATRNFIEHGVNRVILCTDGDFNAGNIVNLPDLTRLIERERQTGVFLTALGFGMGNLKDATLERLADKGNGHYAYIDTFFEARKVLVEQVNGTLVTIAKDVKIQVEFNPAKVVGYRLIGYEDRLLKKEDFNNDHKDAGEIGAGHTVTALYEIVPAGREMPSPAVDPLKYQPTPKPVAPDSPSGELLTVKLRYKQPDGDKSALIEQAVTDGGKGYVAASRDFKFASAVAAFGMVLRDSPHKGNATLASVLELAEESRGPDPSGYRTEFLSLVKKAQTLGRK